MRNKILTFIISLIATLGLNIGCSNASISNSLEKQIKNIADNTPLFLEHYSNLNDLDQDTYKYSWHHSHQSHQSHQSHMSHQSHQSHHSHYSGY